MFLNFQISQYLFIEILSEKIHRVTWALEVDIVVVDINDNSSRCVVRKALYPNEKLQMVMHDIQRKEMTNRVQNHQKIIKS